MCTVFFIFISFLHKKSTLHLECSKWTTWCEVYCSILSTLSTLVEQFIHSSLWSKKLYILLYSFKQVLQKAAIIKNQKDTAHTKAERNILESIKVSYTFILCKERNLIRAFSPIIINYTQFLYNFSSTKNSLEKMWLLVSFRLKVLIKFSSISHVLAAFPPFNNACKCRNYNKLQQWSAIIVILFILLCSIHSSWIWNMLSKLVTNCIWYWSICVAGSYFDTWIAKEYFWKTPHGM